MPLSSKLTQSSSSVRFPRAENYITLSREKQEGGGELGGEREGGGGEKRKGGKRKGTKKSRRHRGTRRRNSISFSRNKSDDV